jgi:hypothetical protein
MQRLQAAANDWAVLSPVQVTVIFGSGPKKTSPDKTQRIPFVNCSDLITERHRLSPVKNKTKT